MPENAVPEVRALRSLHDLITSVHSVQDLSEVGPLSKSTTGGGSAAIVGSLMMVGIATALTVPLGIATALFLNEIGGPLARPLRIIVDAMSAIPSIVAGLFIYAAFIRIAPRTRRIARGLARPRRWGVGDRAASRTPDRACRPAHRGDPRDRAHRR